MKGEDLSRRPPLRKVLPDPRVAGENVEGETPLLVLVGGAPPGEAPRPEADDLTQEGDARAAGSKGGGIRETFMVRKISSGIGVEKVFPIHSPLITGIKVTF